MIEPNWSAEFAAELVGQGTAPSTTTASVAQDWSAEFAKEFTAASAPAPTWYEVAARAPERLGKSLAIGTTNLGGIVGGTAPHITPEGLLLFSPVGIAIRAGMATSPELSATVHKLADPAMQPVRDSLHATGNYIKTLSPEEWHAEISAAAGKDLTWSPEGVESGLLNVAMQVPLLGASMLAQSVGAGAGLLVGGPVGAEVGKHMLGAAVSVTMETDDAYSQMQTFGVTEPIANKYAQAYGLGSGAIEYAQTLGRIGYLKGGALENFKKKLLGKTLGTIGGVAWEGVEEASQQMLQNLFVELAIKEQMAADPTYAARAPALLEGVWQSGKIGSVVSAFFAVLGLTYRGVRGTPQTVTADDREKIQAKIESLVVVDAQLARAQAAATEGAAAVAEKAAVDAAAAVKTQSSEYAAAQAQVQASTTPSSEYAAAQTKITANAAQADAAAFTSPTITIPLSNALSAHLAQQGNIAVGVVTGVPAAADASKPKIGVEAKADETKPDVELDSEEETMPTEWWKQDLPKLTDEQKQVLVREDTWLQGVVNSLVKNFPKNAAMDAQLRDAADLWLLGKWSKNSAKNADISGQERWKTLEQVSEQPRGRSAMRLKLYQALAKVAQGGSVRTKGRLLSEPGAEVEVRAPDTSKGKSADEPKVLSTDAETSTGKKNPAVAKLAAKGQTPVEELIAREGGAEEYSSAEAVQEQIAAAQKNAPKHRHQEIAAKVIEALPTGHPLKAMYARMLRLPKSRTMAGSVRSAASPDVMAWLQSVVDKTDAVDRWAAAEGRSKRVTPTSDEHTKAVAFMQSLGIELRFYSTLKHGGVYASRSLQRMLAIEERRGDNAQPKRAMVLLAQDFTGSELASAVVHESVHHLASEYPELYAKLVAALPVGVRETASKDYYADLSKEDRDAYVDFYEEEGVATAMQLPAQHKEFWDSVWGSAAATAKTKADINFIRKFAAAILKWLHQVFESASRLGLDAKTFTELSAQLGEVYGELLVDVRDQQQLKTVTDVFGAANDVGRALGAVRSVRSGETPATAMLSELTVEPTQASINAHGVKGKPDHVHIASIKASTLAQGQGRKALQSLVALADAHGVTLTLAVRATDPAVLAKGELTSEQLIAWYKRYGFVPRKEGGSWTWMDRVPQSVAPGMGRRAVAPLTAKQSAMFEREDVRTLMSELKDARKAKDSARADAVRTQLDALGATKSARESYYNRPRKGGAPARTTKWTAERVAKTAAYAERLAALRVLVTSFADLENGEVAENVVKAAVGKNGKIGHASMVSLTRELTALRKWLVMQTAGVRGMGAAATRERAKAIKNAERTYAGYANAGSSTSMEHVVARWATQHKLPWQYVYTACVEAAGRAMQAKKKLLATLHEMIGSKSIRKLRKALNDKALEKAVYGALADPQKVTSLTREQLVAYNAIDKHLAIQETDVRVSRVLHAWRVGTLPQTANDKNTTDIHNAPVEDLTKCREIIERSASHADVLTGLETFLTDKTWGVVEAYAPRAALLYDRKYYDSEGDPSRLSAAAARARESAAEPEFQSRTLWQRLDRNATDLTRMKYMEMPLEAVDAMRKIMRRNIEAELKSGRMNQAKFEDTMKTLDTQMKTWLRSLTGHGPQENPGAQLLLRAMSTGLTIHFATQMGTIQNVVQMLVNTDITSFAQLASKFPNADAAQHFALYVDESSVLGPEAALRDVSITSIPGVQQAFGVLKWLGKSFERVDYASRRAAFIARWKKVSRAFGKLKASDTKETLESGAKLTYGIKQTAIASARAASGLTELTDAQWVYAQELWTARGVGALANYAAEQHVANTFYEYMPHKRSFVEQGKMGRIVASLYTFPRCLAQRMLVDVRKVGQALTGRLPLSEGTRAAGRIAFVYVMTNLTWQAVELFARGLTEEEKDKDIERDLWSYALDPQGMWNSVVYSPGGYGASLLMQVKDFMQALGEGVAGDTGADTKVARTLTRLAKTYVPFYRHIIAAINIGLDRSMRAGSWDREQITRLQNIKGILNKTYEYEQSPAQARTALEAFQAFLYGKDTGLVHATATATDYGPATDDKSIADYGNRAKRLLHAALLQGNEFASAQDKERARTEAQRLLNYFARRALATDHAALSMMIFQGDATDRLDFEKKMRAAGMPSQNAAGYYLDELKRTLQESKK